MSSHYFIAVPLPKDIQQWLGDWLNQMKLDGELRYKQWTDPDDFHITLKFLGAVDPLDIEQVADKMDQIDNVAPFELTIGGIGTFGNIKQPRVLWAGVQPDKHLDQLYQRVEVKCEELGYKKENRPYRPHITLAKKWNGASINQQYLELLSSRFSEVRKVKINHFVVYQIHPSRSPKYEVIKEIDLR